VAEASVLGAGRPRDLLAVVKALKPTMLIGTSGEPGTFTEEVVREMAKHVARPLVFPMSNPTSKTEATPDDVIAWTDGRALVATGSPFEPVRFGGKTFTIGQGNNAFIFPGIGLGVLVSEAREVTEAMFAAAAEALAGEVHAGDLASGSLFPPVRDIRRVTAKVAEAVVREARDSGFGKAIEDAAVAATVRGAMWEPAYLPMDPAPVEPAESAELTAV
jgi:malate dehydrogenase (oxaloacetate-decarboxylating)